MTSRRSRLAPSPTGALHLGNARTFLINWAIARQRDWELILRVEDLDGPRVKAEAARQSIDTLTWLGLDFDGEPIWQSADLQPDRRALHQLAEAHQCYACDLTRSEIEAATSAPHRDQHEIRFPPALRPQDPRAFQFGREDTNYRFVTPEGLIVIDDMIAGRSEHDVAAEIGDFVIWTKRGVPAYQLAVVVDDARQGITDVIRGDDLLASAARQTLLYDALGLAPPRWWHLPLVVGPDGRRLAKRHGDSRVETYRHAGVRAPRVIGLLASWSGITTFREEMSAPDFRDRFDENTLPLTPVTFTEDDHRWLLSGY